jgi:hypothetical protein
VLPTDRPGRSRYNSGMKRDAEEILKDALALPSDARAALAAALIQSLDGEIDDDARTAWATEVQRRVAEVDAGEVLRSPGRKCVGGSSIGHGIAPQTP